MSTPSPAAGPRLGPWRRPDLLRLDLSTTLHSGVVGQMDEYGWQTWHGTIVAVWETWETGPGSGVPDSGARGWEEVPAAVADDQVELPLGRILAHTLRFGEQPRSPGAEEVAGAAGLFEAADAISQELTDVVAPLLNLSGGLEVFTDEVLDAVDDDAVFLDELLVMDQTELDPRFRGSGVGAWADARLIALLAPDPCTLVVAKAAPLHRRDFTGGEDRELTGVESRTWNAAQERLWAYWGRTLGLARLPRHRGLLVGLGGRNPARESTLRAWVRP